ncbi:MAG TPA: alpha/beta fold hydrolase [Planctomycetaceae bacterium]|nr:alpha/beta fold hydrolase [Planctomycetaceae bacterium]
MTIAMGTGQKLKMMRRPEWLSQSAWPFESAVLRVGECDVAVTDVGRGPVLLFVHTGLWSFVWRDLLARLSQEFRCVSFDAPGTGLSTRLPTSKISLETAAGAVAAVIRALDLSTFTLVAHDLRGLAGLAGASEMPERVHGLAAINTFAWPPWGAVFRAALGFFGSAPVRELDAITGLVPRITATGFGIGRHLDREARRAFLAAVDPAARRAFHAYLRDARRCHELYERIARALDGPFQGLPVLTVFGERNDSFGFQARWKAMFPRVEQFVIPRGNHFPMCDDPEFVAATIRSWHHERVRPPSPSWMSSAAFSF